MGNEVNILVTGANGQVGMELRALAPQFPSYNFFFASQEDLSITDITSVEKYFQENKFSHCINCAAYTAVDKAEKEQELAFEVNKTAAGNLAAVCKKSSCVFVHFSTDYVFDGNGSMPYIESDLTNPTGIYGASKLEGERAVLRNNDQAIIIRTSWVYSSYGKNFVKTMLRLMKERKSIGVVNDQYGSPTFAADLAAAILQIISRNEHPHPGIYNYCNEGVVNWYEFASEIKILTGSECIIEPITSADYPTPAKRPLYSVLDTTKIRMTFGLDIPTWKESLETCVALLT